MRKLGFMSGMPLGIALALGGCGTYIPEIQENPFSPGDGILMVQAIVQSVRCEMIGALKNIIKEDQARRRPVARFLQHWGAQMTLTLTIEEKSSLAPSLTWMPPSPASAVFALGAGANVGADATRTDKLSFYYLVPALVKQQYCATGVQQGSENSLLVRSDLKLEQILRAYLSTIGTQQAEAPTLTSGALKDDVVSHDIKFDITSGGNLTPSWTLTRVNINPSGTFFSASRERTHDLIITLGPGDDTGFTGNAAPSANASLQLSNAITTGFKSALRP